MMPAVIRSTAVLIDHGHTQAHQASGWRQEGGLSSCDLGNGAWRVGEGVRPGSETAPHFIVGLS